MKIKQTALIRRGFLVLMLLVTQTVPAWALQVTGTVTDSNNEPLTGDTAGEKGNPPNAAATDI